MRDKSHDEALIRWAEFVKDNPRALWKRAVNVLINAQYAKADAFYERLLKTEKGRKIFEKLREERIKKA
ncbi:hypothetical protein HYZ97_04725 [Candidatus Pacearchaeota archaeon]|nr:hypothetical protein [Candidatus Pacearchaeota archaeon]